MSPKRCTTVRPLVNSIAELSLLFKLTVVRRPSRVWRTCRASPSTHLPVEHSFIRVIFSPVFIPLIVLLRIPPRSHRFISATTLSTRLLLFPLEWKRNCSILTTKRRWSAVKRSKWNACQILVDRFLSSNDRLSDEIVLEWVDLSFLLIFTVWYHLGVPFVLFAS